MKRICTIVTGLAAVAAYGGTPINPLALKAAASPSVTIYEDFEGKASATDNVNWLPDGWTRESKGAVNAATNPEATWQITGALTYPPFPNGSYFAKVMYPMGNVVEQDEWLVSPEFTVPAGAELSFCEEHNAPYLFIIDSEHVNFNEGTWISQEISATLQLYYSVDGGEWQKIWDAADRYIGMPYSDMYEVVSDKLNPRSFSLADYAGKNMKIAFRYVGKDGDIVAIDDVRVGVPAPSAKYTLPVSTLYTGFAYESNWTMPNDILAVYPAFEDLCLEVANPGDGTTYTWSYIQPGTSTQIETKTGTSFAELYTPNFESEATSIKSLYNFPLLRAESQGETSTYTPEVSAFQVGGQPMIRQGENSIRLGLLPFNVDQADMDIYTVEPYDFGEPSIPIFGYNNRANQWWTNHYFGEDATPDQSCRIVSLLNYIFPTEKPLVVDSAWLLAKGKIGADALFMAEIVTLNDEFMEDEVIATGTIKGSDMTFSEGGMQDYYNIRFEFDTPAVISTAGAPAYIIRITGFNSDKVEYFAPEMQTTPDDSGLCLGFIQAEITGPGQSGISNFPVANFTNEDGQEMWCAFAINLGGTYAYLERGETTDVLPEITDAVRTVEIPLISYYDGSEITVDVREGFDAQVTGRFNNARLTITAVDGASDGEFDATLNAHGVELKVPFKVSGIAAIDDVASDATYEVTGIYTVDGRMLQTVSVASLPAGIYVVRYANGKAAKIIR